MSKYEKLDPIKIGKYFRAYEFDCPCENCNETYIDPALILRLDAMRDALGCSLHVNSGYRCPAYQLVLKAKGYDTAKTVSQHVLGKAADVTTGTHTGVELEDYAHKSGFTSVGVGKHFVHVDLRTGYHKWIYEY